MNNLSCKTKSGSNKKVPVVSIGVPVFNGEKTLARMLDSLLSQTFSNFEIIISDNASSDKTAEIVKTYADADERIRYFLQCKNIGPEKNFKFVFDQACGEYFLWSAADDTRSSEFLYENVNFLKRHKEYVASTSPNCFEGQDQKSEASVRFELSCSVDDRIRNFFRHAWVSQGVFYSVIRTEVLRDCQILGKSFLGSDWAVDLYLASKGKIHRTHRGMIILGAQGFSKSSNAWKSFRSSPLRWLIPFYEVSIYTMKLTSHRPLYVRIQFLQILFALNMSAAYSQIKAEFYPAYSRIHKFLGKKSRDS